MGNFYLYRHIRLDKNDPFYIGIGEKRKQVANKDTFAAYQRAYDCRRRNILWKGIHSRTDIEVEILLESDDKIFISEKEKEFIMLYGRIFDETGTLANLDLGGYKTHGGIDKSKRKIVSELEYKRRSDIFKKINEQRKGKPHYNGTIPVFLYSISGSFIKEFKSISDAARFLDISDVTLGKKVKNGQSIHGYVIYTMFMGSNIVIPEHKIVRKKFLAMKIAKTDMDGNMIEEYNSIREAGILNNMKHTRIQKNIEKQSVNREGFKFKSLGLHKIELNATY